MKVTLIYRKKNIYKIFDSCCDLLEYTKTIKYRFIDFNYKYQDPIIKLSPLFGKLELENIISVVLT